MNMRITALVENNNRPGGPVLGTEPGLSLFVETNDHKFLFDAGVSNKLFANARELGIDLGAAEFVVLSHGHFDHSGGLPALLAEHPELPLYLSPDALGEYFFKMGPLKKAVGIPTALKQSQGNAAVWVTDAVEPVPGVKIVAKFPRLHPNAPGNAKLLKKTDGGLVPDDFTHELGVIVTEGTTSVGITGCSHNGIQNMIAAYLGPGGVPKLTSVIGGFHLMGIPLLKNSMSVTPAQAEGIADDLLAFDIPIIHTMHCTGLRAYGVMRDRMGERLDYMYCGDVLTF
jgi:7,8-dihydropterin-6-yl-methyl-4-(beta-D-ribofuranosyl)aminobenzene 5'-phosphate synthase